MVGIGNALGKLVMIVGLLAFGIADSFLDEVCCGYDVDIYIDSERVFWCLC